MLANVRAFCGRSSGSSSRSLRAGRGMSAATRKRCIDPAVIFEAARAHLAQPELFKYREDLKGSVDPEKIEEHTALLLAVRSQTGEQALTQSAARDGFMHLAVQNEQSWNLGPNAGKWAAKAARRLRCMLRDVGQALIKERRNTTCSKPWLQPFWDVARSTPSPVTLL